MSPNYYRPDIDGLRALAITGVILHHYDVFFMPSGYVGVDIFFVISGFLIGGIILRGVEAETFSFRIFYRRRILRILPALLVMLMITSIIAYWILLPHALRYYGGGLLTAILSLSNIWFYNRIDYFNPDTHLEPLIHTWSLGVEEQFYLVIPFIILMLWRIGWRGIWLGLSVILIASFIIMIFQSRSNPEAAFYLPFGRFWELLVGVLAYRLRPSFLKICCGSAKWIAGLSLLCLIVFMTMYDSPTWPDEMTLFPICSTALILMLGDRPGPAKAILTAQPAVFLGLISYSLYLYHQPVLVFARIALREINAVSFWALVFTLTITLSVTSWRFIERPFRYWQAPAIIWKMVLVGLPMALVAFAIGGHITKGYPDRLSPELRQIVGYVNSFSETYKSCLPNRKDIGEVSAASGCVHGADVAPDVAVWGDSHAAVLTHSFGTALVAENRSLKELTMSRCTPIVGLYLTSLKRGETCVTRNDDIMSYLLENKNLKWIILNSPWANNLETPWDLQPIEGWREMDNPEEYYQTVIDSLRQQILTLTTNGRIVILMYPIPFSSQNPPEAFADLVMQEGDTAVSMGESYSQFRQSQKTTFETFDALGAIDGLVRVYPHKAFCSEPKDICLTVDARRPLYFDAGHLSLEGVALVVPILIEALQ